jgi:hypothetical protein
MKRELMMNRFDELFLTLRFSFNVAMRINVAMRSYLAISLVVGPAPVLVRNA